MATHTVIKIKNPKTNRMIHYGTPLYAKLVREGVIEPYVPPKGHWTSSRLPRSGRAPFNPQRGRLSCGRFGFADGCHPHSESESERSDLQSPKPSPRRDTELRQPKRGSEGSPHRLKAKLIDTLTDTISENKEQFDPGLTQAETDRLLKRLLFDKLCLDERKTTPPQPKRKLKPKKKSKRFKWKTRKPLTPPSSDSESSVSSDTSDSESD